MSTLERMASFERRRLTDGEIALGRGVFAEAIAWPRVRVQQLPPRLGFGAMAPFRHTILFSGWRAPRDLSRAPLAEQGWFIHELAHLWQATRGTVLPIAKLGALGPGAYDVPEQTPFDRLNIEQQAEVARNVFLERTGAPTKATAYWEELWASRDYA